MPSSVLTNTLTNLNDAPVSYTLHQRFSIVKFNIPKFMYISDATKTQDLFHVQIY